ncbi:hypothetical protein AYI69_g7428 [Smittium culicis]|uniref:Uncharacterized protein n=1 Tax=Smittium culicis TaxID=133412 RepID=A0A1R1XS63_9FUNG|nr:hypothetical protein AYI69_g7428 [Smittium culicis]
MMTPTHSFTLRNGDKIARYEIQGTAFQHQEPQMRSHENYHVYSPASGTIIDEEAHRAEEYLPFQDEIMDIEFYPDRTREPEYTVLDQPTEIMK